MSKDQSKSVFSKTITDYELCGYATFQELKAGTKLFNLTIDALDKLEKERRKIHRSLKNMRETLMHDMALLDTPEKRAASKPAKTAQERDDELLKAADAVRENRQKKRALEANAPINSSHLSNGMILDEEAVEGEEDEEEEFEEEILTGSSSRKKRRQLEKGDLIRVLSDAFPTIRESGVFLYVKFGQLHVASEDMNNDFYATLSASLNDTTEDDTTQDDTN
jgi:hypothetical protein